jgi:hypothetical protein
MRLVCASTGLSGLTDPRGPAQWARLDITRIGDYAAV